MMMMTDSTVYSSEDPSFPGVDADQLSAIISGSQYFYTDWVMTIALAPKVFAAGYFRYVTLPVDSNTGAVEYYTAPPPDDTPQGVWVRVQVVDP